MNASSVHATLAKHYPTHVLHWVKRATWKHDPAVPLTRIDMARRPGARNPEKVAGIADAVKAGKQMPPVVLVDTGEPKLQIADGYHRTLGFLHAGKRTIPAVIASGVGKHGPWEKRMHAAKLNLTAAHVHTLDLAGVCTGPGPCDTTPLGTGKNWLRKVNGLPDYIRAIAHSLRRDHGMDESRAIATAIATVKRWAAGGGNVSAETRARAVKAVAEWEAKKAASHALTAAPSTTIDLANGDRVYHWKHGWIPLDHVAALSKAHGSHTGAVKVMQRHGITPPGDQRARVSIRAASYRGESGYLITGHDTHGRRVQVFAGDRASAEKAITNIRAGKPAFGPDSAPRARADEGTHFRMSGPELRTRAAAGDTAAQAELDRRAARKAAAGGKAGGHRAGVPFQPTGAKEPAPSPAPKPAVKAPEVPKQPAAPTPHVPAGLAQHEQENRKIEAGLPGHTITSKELASITPGAPARVIHTQHDANGDRVGSVIDRGSHGGYRASLNGNHIGDFETRAGAHQALAREHDRAKAEATRKAAEKATRDARSAAANSKKAAAVATGLKGPGGHDWKPFEFKSDGSRIGDKAAAKVKQSFIAGDSTVLIETPMSKEQTRALLSDITATVDRTGLAGVTFHVPSGDGKFRSTRSGVTGAYVRMGQRTVFINPKVANGTYQEQFGKSQNFMPANAGSTGAQYVLTHELGHILDQGSQHTFEAHYRDRAAPSMGHGQVLFHSTNEEARKLEAQYRDELSKYGRTNLAESYAEAFAQWTLGGPGSSKVADAYAAKFGWSRPKSGRQVA